MANTTNLDLVKPAGTDHALISVLNSNSDKIDAFAGQTKDDIETLEEGLAYIVGNTNTTGETLAVGQFVYVKGHSTIPNGLRKVTASISNNASITTSNTSPDTAGGLNTLNSNINKCVTVRRSIVSGVQVTTALDTNITQGTILQNISGGAPDGYSILSIVPEGARPLTTWDCKPFIFYNNATYKWTIHNNGTQADAVEATFIVTFIKTAINQ